MSEIPADAQRSPDGYYWWDGSKWQPVEEPFEFNPDDYPALKLYAESGSPDDVLRHLGIDASS
jgi:hypothetical protein